jgi:pimeloyl-ACP methyl ester carboxylesterase
MEIHIEHRPSSAEKPLSDGLFPTGAAAVAARDAEAASSAGAIHRAEHYLSLISTAPATQGDEHQLYVREVSPGKWNSSPSEVVLFVHGGTYPSTPDYDLFYRDYSWMASMARINIHAFAVDMIGYGKSSRPSPMDDPRNLSAEDQALLVPEIVSHVTEPMFPSQLVTVQSDWDAIDTVVDFIVHRTGLDRVNLVGWSGGGPRIGGYAAHCPEKVGRLVLLAPAYNRDAPIGEDTDGSDPPNLRTHGSAFAICTREFAFANRWDPQVKCANQYDPAIREALWEVVLEQDSIGATWVTPRTGGTGVVRRPSFDWRGWDKTAANSVKAPTLVIVGELDGEVLASRTMDLYSDIGAADKAHVTIECASHYVPWERAYKTLHSLSHRWLLQ